MGRTPISVNIANMDAAAIPLCSNHVRQWHHEAAGLPPPPKWTCEKCGKNFRTHGGSKGHSCKVVKPKRKPAAAKGKRKCLMWCIN